MYGPTSYASIAPVRSLADFKGRKFRVLATKVETEIMRRLGATGVRMPYSETVPGLQRKLIDRVRSNIVVMNATKHWTVAKYITVVNDTYIPCAGFVSMVWYNKLPKTCSRRCARRVARSRTRCPKSASNTPRGPKKAGATAAPR